MRAYLKKGLLLIAPLMFSFTVQSNPLCDNPQFTDLPLKVDGAGEACFIISGDIAFVHSWSMDNVTISDVDYTNVYSSTMPDVNQEQYYIYYSSSNDWSHFEVGGVATLSVAVTE